eukprot:Opistho-2@20943
MDISAAQHNDASPRPGSLAHWLADHAELAAEIGQTLLSLVEPLNSFAAVKSLATGRYVFASAGLAQLLERADGAVVGSTDNDLMRADEAIGMRRVEQTVMAQRSVVVSEHRLELGGRRREFSVTRAPLGQDHLLPMYSALI